MDDTIFTIAFAKGYAAGELIKLRAEMNRALYVDRATKEELIHIIDNRIEELKEGKE